MENLRCLLATPGLTISYDTSNQWLYVQWVGMHDKETVRVSAEHIFASLAAYPCLKMISDHSQLIGNWQAAIPSVVQHNFERLAAHGVRYVAWVHSFDDDDLVAMERVVRNMPQPLVGLFDEVDSASDWLLHCPVDLPRRPL
ncbi:hypothetical protein FNT36_18355 [Hymenobacter setariae]|uniref:STAS/SEC14 domain-containing protein n=1 Tax=Hymenobacter setariae TaxID=2594794 RepID=A0A558BSZ1_9BACT|nr:hypothetical protein [Hymenobacter setariae]TVT39605.1 hypothetical protein FNT36_18355 [Hymenobacter setariae]